MCGLARAWQAVRLGAFDRADSRFRDEGRTGNQARLHEAAYVTPAPDFLHIEKNPSEEYKLEVSVGYPFIEYAPIPNFFGFGPGKFGIAVKLFSFFVTAKNEVRVRMTFAAAPHAAKVFDFGRIPDPVYGGAGLLSNLSLGLWKTDAFHDRMDTEMLTEHCRVHQALMEGVQPIWMSWYGGSAEKI